MLIEHDRNQDFPHIGIQSSQITSYNKTVKQLFKRQNKTCVSEVKNKPLISKHL